MCKSTVDTSTFNCQCDKGITSTNSLADKLPEEMHRVWELIKVYQNPLLKGSGAFAIIMMEKALKDADKALMACDVVEMIRCYKKLKDFSE